jgi:DNA-binding CsgD family transcriptional regulator
MNRQAGRRSIHGIHFDAAIDQLSAIDPDTDVMPLLRAMMSRVGLDHCAYLARSIPGAESDDPLFLTTYPDAWVARYIDRGYVFIDPVLKQAARSLLPIDWAAVDRKPTPVRRLFGESREFGVGMQGLTSSIRGPFGDRAVFSINSHHTARDWQLLRPELTREVQFFALHLHQHMMARALPRPEIVKLTRRETESLSLAADGHSAKEIARKLRISPAAVRAYLDGARSRLRTANRAQTIAKAVKLGLI